GHCELALFIESVRRAPGFVFELVAGAAHACALWIAALDHEVRNHAVENRAVVERVLALGPRGRMRPLALAFGKLGKVGNGLGRPLLEQPADDVALGGIEHGVGAGRACHCFSSLTEISMPIVLGFPSLRRPTALRCWQVWPARLSVWQRLRRGELRYA